MPRAQTESGRTSDTVNAETTSIKFDDFLLKPELLKAIEGHGFLHPSPVQSKAIPTALDGDDLLIQAKSGTGKTLSFGLVLLQKLMEGQTALILCPTREIALQTEDVITRAGWFLDPPIQTRSFVGGTPEEEDIEKCSGCQIFVGTPGRVHSLMLKKYIPTPLRFLVLDEADKLLDESFRDKIENIVALCNIQDSTQFICASATFSPPLINIAEKLLNPRTADGKPPTRELPTRIFLCTSVIKRYDDTAPMENNNDETAVLQGVRQAIFPVEGVHVRQKVEPLWEVLSAIPFNQCIVFLNNFTQAEQVTQMLNAKGVRAVATSSKHEQAFRRAVLIDVKRFHYRCVVASDLWSRGVDVDKVDLVINMDIPAEKETYLHRVGRAGRFGKIGLVVNILFTDEVRALEYYRIQLDLKLFNWNDRDDVLKDINWNEEEIIPKSEVSIPFDTFDTKEKRIDPVDGSAYTLNEFIEQYGGTVVEPPQEWFTSFRVTPSSSSNAPATKRSQVEWRMDEADGNMYTIEEFCDAYGGTSSKPPVEWQQAPGWYHTRIDPADGNRYTLVDFVAEYGGSLQQPPEQWINSAETHQQGSLTDLMFALGNVDALQSIPEKPHEKIFVHEEDESIQKSSKKNKKQMDRKKKEVKNESQEDGYRDTKNTDDKKIASTVHNVGTAVPTSTQAPSNIPLTSQPLPFSRTTVPTLTPKEAPSNVLTSQPLPFSILPTAPLPPGTVPFIPLPTGLVLSLQERFPPPPIPNKFIHHGIPIYEPWMQGLDYLTYAQKLQERAPLNNLIAQHWKIWAA